MKLKSEGSERNEFHTNSLSTIDSQCGRPTADEWDRLFNVDFFIKIGDKYIGLQIKPASGVSHIPEIFKERNQQAATHQKFTERYGGKVFYVVSVKDGKNKVIHNNEVVDEIRAEIRRLGG